MNIEELEKAEQASWANLKSVTAEHKPIIDAAQNEWHKLHVALMKEKQRALIIAEIKAELEAENATGKEHK